MPIEPQLNRRILIVDDNAAIHSDFRKVLQRAPTASLRLAALESEILGTELAEPVKEVGFDLESAFQGDAAVECVQAALAAGKPYAMAFVDVRMPPGLDGIETIVKLWQVDARLEIVICSAFSDYSWHQMLERLSRQSQFLILGKPFETIAVRQAALALTEKWARAREAEEAKAGLESQVAARTSELSATNQKLQVEIDSREKVESQVRHAQRLEALGTLVAGVAHEINNPLAFVLSNLGFIQDALEMQSAALNATARDELLEVAKETQTGASRIQQVVRDLKAFSHPSDAALERVEVGSALDFAVRMVSSQVQSTARLIRSHGALPCVHGNLGRLGQVFVNLIVNATQAIKPNDFENNEIEIGSLVELGWVTISIRDTGSGIPPESLARIFDPFFTTKPIGQGTGLGLSVCHGIIQTMGGTLTVKSELGRGTTFFIRLPISTAPAAEPQRSAG